MNNNDYNEPMVDYEPQEQPQAEQVYEEQPQVEQVYEEQPLVEEMDASQQIAPDYSTIGQNMNNGYAYNNYNSGYTNVGGTVIDSNGEELKNRFGLKLTFSILEMLCCCGNCANIVLGIIACIFTCQANSCYKEGRYDEFKTKAKISKILLIIGAVIAAVSLAINAYVFSKYGYMDLNLNGYEQSWEGEWRVDGDGIWEEEIVDDYDESL